MNQANKWLALMEHERAYVEYSDSLFKTKALFPSRLQHDLRTKFRKVFARRPKRYDKQQFQMHFGERRQRERRNVGGNGFDLSRPGAKQQYERWLDAWS